MDQTTDHRVTRRQVFYIPGYDPHPPRRYRELYRKEAARQAAISGHQITLSADSDGPGYGWQVDSRIDGAAVQTRFEVLVWSDLVRASMGQGIGATYAALLRTAWIYLTSGALRALMRLRKGPVIAALYPVAMLLAQALAAAVLAALAGRLAYLASWRLSGLVALGWAVALAVALAVLALVLRWFRDRDRRIYAYYLMHDYAYGAALRGANPPELDQRIAAFADRIAQALTAEFDEVLVVGHSSGAHIAVQVLAALEHSGRLVAGGPAVGFLSLGQVVPMVSFLPAATRLRADLHDLSLSRAIAWVDVSAPGDGCCFALCDPVAVSGVAPAGKRGPLVISAAFSQTLARERWRRLKRRFFQLHFQYLCAFEHPRDYDYFAITAGPRTLADRFRGRAPSKSRIDVAASPYAAVLP